MVIVEGIDGTGKTVVVSKLKELGMNTMYYEYDYKSKELISKYQNIDSVKAKNIAMDRSYISEITYGSVVRGNSRLTIDDFIYLLDLYSSLGTTVVYLKADLKTLLERRRNNLQDLNILKRYYIPLNKAYDQAMEIVYQYMPVIEFNTAKTSVDDIIQTISQSINIMRK